MKLFTKQNCEKCDYVKSMIPQDTEITKYDIQTVEGLAELALAELVSVAEKALPILINKEGEVITGAIKIKQEIERSFPKGNC